MKREHSSMFVETSQREKSKVYSMGNLVKPTPREELSMCRLKDFLLTDKSPFFPEVTCYNT